MARTMLFVARGGRGNGADMQAVLRSRGLVVAILAIAMLSAVFVITCSDGIHVLSPAGAGGACVTMSHSSVLGAVVGSGVDRSLASAVFATMAGLATFIVAVRTAPAFARGSDAPGTQIDPLNRRLRL